MEDDKFKEDIEVSDSEANDSASEGNTSEIIKRLGVDDDDDDTIASDDATTSDADDEVESEAEEEEDDADIFDDSEEKPTVVAANPAAAKKSKKSTKKEEEEEEQYDMDTDEGDEEEDDDDEQYLQKFDQNIRRNIIEEYHPELIQHNDEEIETLCKVVRDADGIIIDPLHKTLPFVTKYEKARILGERAKQINSGAKPFIKVEKHIIDGYLIALREYEEKKIPFIIRRPLPNGASEYWKLADLQFLD